MSRDAQRVLRRGLPALMAVIVGIAGAWLGMRILGSDTVRMGPFAVDLSSGFGRGQTVIGLPPLGEMRADTHDTPIDIRATLVGVDVQQLTDELEEKSTRAIVDDVESDARSQLPLFALRVLGVAAGGALLVGALVFRRRWRLVLLATATAAVLVGGSEAVAWRTLRPQAFAEPAFAGTLRLAPQLLGPAQDVTKRIDEFRANLERIVRSATRAYTALGPQAIGGDELRVLHISDIHLNAVGLDFATELAHGFDVDFVLDTGDLTSYGTPLEEIIVSQIPRFRRPYVFVRGNHDSPGVARRVAATKDTTVLDGNAQVVEGLTIYGRAHPVFTENQQEDVDTPELQERARAIGPRIAEDVDGLDDPPDVIAVHDDRMAEALAGRVPVVLSGHYHHARATTIDGTLYLRAGSTGGAGVNMFKDRQTPVPFSATILHFERAERPELIAYDVVEQSPITGRLTIQRHLVSEIQQEPSPSPTAGPGAGR